MVIVDAETGEAYLRPRTDVVKAIQARIEVRRQRRAGVRQAARHARLHPRRAKITLLMNAGLDIDLDILGDTGAEGIGLSAPSSSSWSPRRCRASTPRPRSTAG